LVENGPPLGGGNYVTERKTGCLAEIKNINQVELKK
jgi:hypothetical protein